MSPIIFDFIKRRVEAPNVPLMRPAPVDSSRFAAANINK
jgi:hypothetical protein